MRRLPGLLAAASLLLLAAGCSAFVPNSRDELVGRWEGSVLFRSAMTPLVLEVHRGADSALAGVLSAPELLIHEQPVDSIVWDAPRVRFVAAEPGLPLRFEGFARAGRIVGRIFSPLLPPIDRAEALPKVSLRRMPVVPAPYALRRVTIETRGASLSATLRLPADSLRHPGIVFVQAEPRPHFIDVSALADTFARSGWATLCYEPRGEQAASLAELISDAASASRWLGSQPGVDGRVGVWGASLAGMFLPRVASQAPLAFVVAVSAPGVSLQRASMWRDSVRGITREATAPRWGAVEQTRDPAPDWARVGVPVLLLHGERDDQLPVAESLRAILEASGTGGRLTTHEFPAAGHELHLWPRDGEPFDWPRAAPGYVDTLLAWTGRVAGVAPRPVLPDTGMPRLELRPGWR